MNTHRAGAPSWKAELSRAAARLLSAIDDTCLERVRGVARGLPKAGLHKLAKLLTQPRPPVEP